MATVAYFHINQMRTYLWYICNDYINTHKFYSECLVYCTILLARINCQQRPSALVTYFHFLFFHIFNILFFTFATSYWNFHPFLLLSIITRFCVKSYTSSVSGRLLFHVRILPYVLRNMMIICEFSMQTIIIFFQYSSECVQYAKILD